MADSNHGGGETDFDLTQFYQIFFEEAGENLDQMEQILLSLTLENAGDEELNAIFRCAHSIKGGAATFGFVDVAELTHHMESLLDKLRRHELTPVPQMVDVLLESADASRMLLARHQAGAQDQPPSTAALIGRIAELASGNVPAPSARQPDEPPISSAIFTRVAHDQPPPDGPSGVLPSGVRRLQISVRQLEQLAEGDAIKELFRDIPGLGSIEDSSSEDPSVRNFLVCTSATDDDLLDLFAFHVAKDQVVITTQATGGGGPDLIADVDQSFGIFDNGHASEISPSERSSELGVAPTIELTREKFSENKVTAQPAVESTTIRVAVNKVDQLINLVGELVITQAMLAQNSRGLDAAIYQQMLTGLADLDRNTRDLQESVMSIRMIPMSIVFSRFPRMLRDLANKLGKKVDFVTIGEATELDKGLVEKIADPLTHLVRNSCDHGIELPSERLARGKPENGTITLSASHQGGSIVIEVRDDGRGLSREKILRKAKERGLDVSDQMTDEDVWPLIFAPGFSTADVVTDVSGRGVGLDVVKRNISALNGSVEIESNEGMGMRISVRLPLTLAIMDGMSVGVGEEVYILPLSSVVESFQVKSEEVSTVAQGPRLVKVRDEYMPVIAMEELFQIPRETSGSAGAIMVVIEFDGSRVALLVDQLLGQQQVVVKNLETNYRKVPNVSGATILGDGTVALILDAGSMVRRARH